ncbi:MAG TPA: TlpA disulfide reductase family protein [Polyangiaceae bacterium]
MTEPGRDLPRRSISRAQADGEKELPESLAVGAGKWTWINFWAAWCVPCKEEIPRLLAWSKQLTAQGKHFRVAFVSLDDDARQLETFLQSQPPTGLRSTYWLRDGEQRRRWLQDAAIDTDPELPAHLLVDPRGRLRCRVQGAVEDRDFARVATLVGG